MQVGDSTRVLTSPIVPERERREAIGRLVPNLARPVQALVDLLITRERFELLPEILADFRRRVDEYRGVVTVQVTTAQPLDADSERVIVERLSKLHRQAGAARRTR